jgi:hypothetical protein
LLVLVTFQLSVATDAEIVLTIAKAVSMVICFAVVCTLDPILGAVQAIAPESQVIEKIANKLRYL